MRDAEHAEGVVGRDPVDQGEWEPREQPSPAPTAHRAADLGAVCRQRDDATKFGDEFCAEVLDPESIVFGCLTRIGQRIRMKRDRPRR